MKEKICFDKFGVMIDCSRNAVMNVSAFKKMADILSSLGYNTIRLYTEDTYEVDGEPYFGYLRGRYSKAELREMDAYAAERGVELIPCIQTLAHLATTLRWPCYSGMVDCRDIMMAGEDSTYALVEKMVAHMARCLRSRRINIGMDEAYMIGLGKYREKHGIRPAADIMLEHVERVMDICRKYGYAPMMWSDMFFHMAAGGYTGEENAIPQEVIDRVPPEMTQTICSELFPISTSHNRLGAATRPPPG